MTENQNNDFVYTALNYLCKIHELIDIHRNRTGDNPYGIILSTNIIDCLNSCYYYHFSDSCSRDLPENNTISILEPQMQKRIGCNIFSIDQDIDFMAIVILGDK